jgi:hypothetical protein
MFKKIPGIKKLSTKKADNNKYKNKFSSFKKKSKESRRTKQFV